MGKLVALSELKDGTEVIGYKITDGKSEARNIKVSAVLEVMTKKGVHIENLELANGKIVFHNKSDDTNISRIKELTNELSKANYEYEQNNKEIMSNYEYDKKFDELNKLEKETGVILENSPTHSVGYAPSGKHAKVTFKTKMLSLDKRKDTADLKALLGNREGVLSWKLDGLTIVLRYHNGKLVQGITRGNGVIGEDVTANILHINNLPLSIPFQGDLELRGEAVLSYSDFDRIKESDISNDDEIKLPRSIASGSIRGLNPAVVSSRNIQWIGFNIVECSNALPKEYSTQLKFLNSLGFSTVDYELVTVDNIDEAIERFEHKISNCEFDIPSDGLVLKLNDTEYGKSLGVTDRYVKDSLAFKWQDELVDTTLEDIVWQVGKSGKLTPVAIFEPTEILGSVVRRASLHNLNIMAEKLGQPYVGQKLKIFKANMVIPNVESAEKQAEPDNPLYIPSYCPCCGSELEFEEDSLWCYNPSCGDRGIRLLKHFVSRNAMNMDGIGKQTLIDLVDANIVTDYVSIFNLEEYEDDIINMPGYGEVSYDNIIEAVNNARVVKLANFIYALAIPEVGLATAKLVCKNFNNDISEIMSADVTDFASIDGIGYVIASNLYDFFNNEENIEEINSLLNEIEFEEEDLSTTNEMNGVTVCITGTVNIFENRDQAKAIVEKLGGKLTGSVSRSTTYLVTNDTTSGSRKNVAAQNYGIPILTEVEFIEKFGLEKYI